MNKLTIISHTEHYKNSEGTIVGLGSTVTEINHLLHVFDEIIHVAMLHEIPAPPSAMPYISDKITFIPIPAVGGKSIVNKMGVILKAPHVLRCVSKTIKQTDVFQFRAPTGIGTFVIPYLILFSSKKGWFKYAGNWKQRNAPMAYRFQRWLLKNQNRAVTINGRWPDQQKHCLTFENPCLSLEEVKKGQEIIKAKTLTNDLLDFCFVGRLEEEKGLGLLIQAFNKLNIEHRVKIGKVHIVGDGKSINLYKKMVSNSHLDFVFHGFLSRKDVQDVYRKSHAIILPSASEGFPKVISEAMNFGCIPIVSNVSGIGNYIGDEENGFLLNSITVDDIVLKLQELINLSPEAYASMVNSKKNKLERFTYTFYNKRIMKEIVK